MDSLWSVVHFKVDPCETSVVNWANWGQPAALGARSMNHSTAGAGSLRNNAVADHVAASLPGTNHSTAGGGKTVKHSRIDEPDITDCVSTGERPGAVYVVSKRVNSIVLATAGVVFWSF